MGLFGFRKKQNPEDATTTEKQEAIRKRYEGKPLLLILDNYIADCIGALPAEKQAGIARIVMKAFGGGEDWHKTVRQMLKLHDSLDDSIRQAWKEFSANNSDADAVAFAAAFSDQHFLPLIEGTPQDRGDRATDPAQQREAQERKNRSLAMLRERGVPFIEHLPTIETAATARIRKAHEVARRATVLALLAAYSEPGSFPVDELKGLLEKRNVANDLTPREREYLQVDQRTEQQRAQFTWQYECVNVLLWALGYINPLEYPGKICDVPGVARAVAQSDPETFVQEAKLREASEILDEADLIYRYDWACVNARAKEQPAPAGLNGGVVLERHRALNWLIGYGGHEWDEVKTDT